MGRVVNGPLDGINVVDATAARAGPACARQLADLGADVIQVGQDRPSFGASDYWNLHRNKRSIALNLKDPDDHELVLDLVDHADVFLENWRPGVKHRLGLAPEVLLRRNPRLVYGSISGYGQDGPYAGRPSVDQIAQGMGGLMAVTGPPGSGPWRVGVAVTDLTAGTLLAQGIIAALFARERTGRGQWVHTSLLEAAVHLLDFQATRWVIDGDDPGQEGNSHPTISAIGLFDTADGQLNLGVLGSFDRFAEFIGRPDLVGEPRFATHEGRTAHKGELVDELAAVLRTRTTQEWLDLLSEAFPAGPVYRVSEVFADPQVRHLGLTATVPLADGRQIDVLRHPVTFSDTPATIRSGPPTPGQHTDQVKAEMAVRDRVRRGGY